MYLTTWGEFLLNIYLLSAFILAVYYHTNPDLIYKISGAKRPGKFMKNFELFVGVLRIWAFDMSLSLSIGMDSNFYYIQVKKVFILDGNVTAFFILILKPYH